MSQNTQNLASIPQPTPISSQNPQPHQPRQEKQENPQQAEQILNQSPQNNQQNVPIEEQNLENSRNQAQLKPVEQLKLNPQNSMQLSSRIQNTAKNINFNSLNIQKVPSCHCKKSKCLKMYCDCYAKGNKCRETCKCIGCENTKNSFRQKKPDCRNDEEIQRSEDSNKKSLKPKERSCNCKKSFCLKKYCQCFNANQPCGETCKCQDCKNNGENNNFRDDKVQGSAPVLDTAFYNITVNRQNSEVMSQANGVIQRKQELSIKKRQKPDEDEIETKLSQILKLVPQQNYQTMLDFLAYCLS